MKNAQTLTQTIAWLKANCRFAQRKYAPNAEKPKVQGWVLANCKCAAKPVAR